MNLESVQTFSAHYRWEDRKSTPSSEGVVSQLWLEEMRREFGVPDFILRLCYHRGIRAAHELREFLSPQLERLGDPFAMKDMDRAVERVVGSLKNKTKFWILGDYDVDGTCGTAVLSWFFREIGANFEAFQPDRFLDGYGLNQSFADRVIEAGVDLLITVDCGITANACIEKLEASGTQVIVLDHHAVDPAMGVPKGTAIIDAHRPDCLSGYKELCGTGVAFFFLRALRKYLHDDGFFKDGVPPNLKQHLDLISLATAADLVPLRGQNHILVRHGMEMVTHSKKPGFMKLLEISGLMQRVSMSPSSLGFALAPRINASGRMQNARIALDLLTTQDSALASRLGAQIEAMNLERQEVQNRIWDEVRAAAEAGIQSGKFPHAIVLASESWHEGVVGIVASRVVETFHRPAIVIAIRDGHAKGSVRSALGKDVLEGLRQCREHLIGFGGHKHAAGVSLHPETVDAFCQSYNDAMSRISSESKDALLFYDAWSDLNELHKNNIEWLEKLGPFGPGNPEPVFLVKARAVSFKSLKYRHLRVELFAEDSQEVREGIWFGVLERKHFHEDFLKKDSLWAVTPELNRFRGQTSVQLRIKDWRSLETFSEKSLSTN